MIGRLSAISLTVTCIITSCGFKGARDMGIEYPGNRIAKDTAVLFAQGLISTEAFEHSSPSFSPDGQTVLWSIVELPSWKASILEMNFDGKNWSAPHRPVFSDTTASDISPSFSPDGRHLYFSSGRKLPSGEFPPYGNVLWFVEKTESGWATPRPVDSLLSMSGAYSPSIATNGNLYFTFGPFRSPDWNVLMAERVKGQHIDPVKLVSPVNSNGYEDGAFVAPDESYLIFESDRPGGIGGSIDLYISFRTTDGNWGPPVNLGPGINSSSAERFGRVSPDGKFLFFGSNRRQVAGEPNFDIYWIAMTNVMAMKE